jgi:uncharacterized protein
MHLEGSRVVLTGAASGIGAAILRVLGSGPCGIVAVDRDEPRLLQTMATLRSPGCPVTPVVADLGRPEEVDRAFEYAQEKLGGIDIFIANAGFAYYERLAKADWQRMHALLSVNVISPLYTAVRMEEINPDRQHRTVVVASAMGQLAIPGYALYSGSKAALHRFAEAYRFELSDPASLTMVYPIGTRTRFFDAGGHKPAPLPWPTQSAEQVARAVVRGIERDQKDIYPSGLFRTVLIADRFLPFVRRIEQKIEGRRFRRWLRG